jgi:hypothetical protein
MAQASGYMAGTVAAADGPVTIEAHHYPATIAVFPAAGATVRVQYSMSPKAAITPDASNWLAWPAGDVTAAAAQSIVAPVRAFRVTALVGSCSYEVAY